MKDKGSGFRNAYALPAKMRRGAGYHHKTQVRTGAVGYTDCAKCGGPVWDGEPLCETCEAEEAAEDDEGFLLIGTLLFLYQKN